MTDAVVQFVEGALDSPWGLLALAAVAAVDGFFPVVPSESLVVTAGVFAAAGDQSLALVIAAAALGAFVGDHVSYAVGSQAGDKLIGRFPPGTRRGAAYTGAAKVLDERGGTVIVVARYVPGGRTAVTLTAGRGPPSAVVLQLLRRHRCDVLGNLRRARRLPGRRRVRGRAADRRALRAWARGVRCRGDRTRPARTPAARAAQVGLA